MAFRFPRWARGSVTRFAEVVCPPELRTLGLQPLLLDELELYLGATPRSVRLGYLGGVVALDLLASLWPPARGRRLARLDDARAERWYLRCAAGGTLSRTLVKLVKSLTIFVYYELPPVKRALGFNPDGYIAQVARRRLERHGAAVRAGEAALYADDPLIPLPRLRRRAGAGGRP